MKSGRCKRFLAGVLAGILILTGTALPAYAEEGGTVAGAPETIQVSANTPAGRESNFNEGWKFYLGDNKSASSANFDDSAWTAVTLPHDFSISQAFTASGEAESGFLPGGTGWYRKGFTLSSEDAGKRVTLKFDGAYSDAYVYVNGAYVGENHYGYTAFAFDITDYLTCDGATENVVAVKVVNDIPSSRWYSGSGIYRDVTLIVTDPVHVDLDGVYVTTPDIASGGGTVRLETEVVNGGASDAQVRVVSTVYTKAGEQASEPAETTVTVGAGRTETAAGEAYVANPALWSTETPNLYFVRTELYVDGARKDSVDTTFGFRYFRFDSDTGFYLNGQALKLNGVCLHHDQGALGSAAYEDTMYRQLSIMKDMGVNAVRTSHNPADADFIDICNELGLLVVEEAFDGWSVAKNGNSNDFSRYFSTALGGENGILGGDSTMTWAEYAVKSMVRRDRNDPSVILWSLGNEIQEGAYAASNFPTIAQNLIDWIKEEDDTRPATIGSNQRTTSGTLGSVHSVVAGNGGVVGFNYASASELASLHAAYGPIIATETSSAVNSRGIYSSQANAANADGRYHLTSYDTSAVSWGKTAHASLWDTLTLDYVAGEFVWTGFDYIGEPTPWNGTGSGSVSGRGAMPNSSYFGIVDTAGFEKDTYYLYRSQWNQTATTLHLVTAWDEGNMLASGGKTPVVVYSNAPVVKLYRNGTLIGTATRSEHTTAAGHTYYTYTAASNDSAVCSAVSASGSASLYATFNVSYEAGTISARAFEADGVTERAPSAGSGRSSVSTPGAAAKLSVTADKTVIAADGSSLAYIEVEVQDAQGNLDTTAVNTITFSLNGNGEILGVDNGDQATKYQQSSVLTSASSARIAAYAGKALVIVRSTKDAGSFTVDVSADGLTGGSASVTTTAVEDGGAREGLVSYTLVRDYTLRVGTVPSLLTDAAGEMADGTEVVGTIVWEEIPVQVYQTAGDYTISGTLTFPGLEPIQVIARLHVIADVIALRNISTATTPGTVPTLPGTVRGVLADGTLSGEFAVTWEDKNGEDFACVGETVTVKGTAVILGDVALPVTASVRVAEAVNTESVNVAPSAAELTQDIAADKQSDVLESIRNGVTKPGDNTSERWTNWNNRTTSAQAALTFRWDTAQLLSGVNLYYYYDSCSAYPEAIAFSYSLNGTDFVPVDYTSEQVESYSLGAHYSYTFAQSVNPVALKITFTQQGGVSGSHCVGITEAEIMTYAGKLEYQSSAALSAITVDGTPLADFDVGTLAYTAAGSDVAAESAVNAGITILPAKDGVVRILTVSEDGSDGRTYEVTLSDVPPVCLHGRTEIRGQKEPGCTEEGYTGDIWCLDCGEQVSAGKVVPANGHSPVLLRAVPAACTEEGYTGDEVCTVCGETLRTGTSIPAAGHRYDNGVVTKEPTALEEGIKTYTCTVCGEQKTEPIPVLPAVKTVPRVSLTAAANGNGKIALTAQIEGLNDSNYYTVTAHGFVYQTAARLGTRTLSVNTPGRTRVNCTGYRDAGTGTYVYNMTPASLYTRYVVRSYLVYTNAEGRSVYVYSDPVYITYMETDR